MLIVVLFILLIIVGTSIIG
ncbi:YjcZ family sporulation protein [Saccharococcus caldoxylosilyticus]